MQLLWHRPHVRSWTLLCMRRTPHAAGRTPHLVLEGAIGAVDGACGSGVGGAGARSVREAAGGLRLCAAAQQRRRASSARSGASPTYAAAERRAHAEAHGHALRALLALHHRAGCPLLRPPSCAAMFFAGVGDLAGLARPGPVSVSSAPRRAGANVRTPPRGRAQAVATRTGNCAVGPARTPLAACAQPPNATHRQAGGAGRARALYTHIQTQLQYGRCWQLQGGVKFCRGLRQPKPGCMFATRCLRYVS